MKYAAALSALAAITLVSAQTPDGCSSDYSGTFEYNPVPVSGASKRDFTPLHKRQGGTCTAEPFSTLTGGVLTDQCKRTGEIVANYQFQYDLQTQNNALNTGGFSICSNGTLAVAGSAIFYHCLSGSFYNLYDESLGGQCSQVYLEIIPCTPPPASSYTCPSGTPSSPNSAVTSSSSSSSSTSSALATLATSSASSPAAAVTSAAVSSAAAPVVAAPVYTVSMAYVAPSSNTTAPATGTGIPVAPTSTAVTSPIAFHGGAASLAMGGKLLVSAVGIAALAFLA